MQTLQSLQEVVKSRIKEIGVAIYLLGLCIHRLYGDNSLCFWVALFFIIQNIAMSLVCLHSFNSSDLFKKLTNRIGFTYFTSASLFYIIAITTNQLVYFSDSGFAGNVLVWLIGISITITLIDAYATRK